MPLHCPERKPKLSSKVSLNFHIVPFTILGAPQSPPKSNRHTINQRDPLLPKRIRLRMTANISIENIIQRLLPSPINRLPFRPSRHTPNPLPKAIRIQIRHETRPRARHEIG